MEAVAEKATWTGSLTRFPQFLRAVIQAIKSEQAYRTAHPPSLLYPYMQRQDVFLSLIIGAILFILRIYGEQRLFPKLFHRYGKRERKKLAENLFYALYYTCAFAYYASSVRPNVGWGRVNLLDGKVSIVRKIIYPYPPEMVTVERVYYAQAWGFYTSAMMFLVMFDTRRSDFWELVLHHVVTLGLVAMSYLYGYVRAGILILALHDVGDILLYLAKFVHYLGWKGVDTAIFASFAVTFYVTRLAMFSRLVFAIIVETMQVLVIDPKFNRWAMYYDTYLVHYAFFAVCLSTLLFLHCFWFALILKMIYREVFLGKKVSDEGDIRSDNEDGDEQVEDNDDGFLDGDESKKDQ